MSRKRQRLWIAGVATGVFVAFSLACNYHWYPFRTNYQLHEDPLRLVSVVPAAKGESGQFEPVCMGEKEATGVILSMAILGVMETGMASDQDLSVRPGDIVKTVGTKDQVVVAEGESIGPKNFRVKIECLERYPDLDIGGNRDCQGLENPGAGDAPPVSFRYVSPLPPDEYGSYTYTRDLSVGRVGVAILIDQSGSMKGFVDPTTYVDVTEGMPHHGSAAGFASDLQGQRVTAVKDFLMKLNPLDKAIVFQYGESVGTKAKVVCYDAMGNTPEEALRERCYTADRGLVLDEHVVQDRRFPPALDQLVYLSIQPARSPLWAAVDDVYDFMKSRSGDEVRHILVINDGPDTCHVSSPDYRPVVGTREQGVCSTVGYDSFRSRVLEDLEDPNTPRVHIHFVQFQAHGYLEHDPRQQEVACLTGGHYQFVNSIEPVKLGGGDWTPLYEALREAVLRVRYSLLGTWQMAVEVPDLTATVFRGAEYSIKSTITMVGAGETLSATDQFLHLQIGDLSLGSLATLDRRGVFRLPCSSQSECDWFVGTAPECREVACVTTDAICGFKAVQDLQSCGTKGICCNGWCAEGKTACQK